MEIKTTFSPPAYPTHNDHGINSKQLALVQECLTQIPQKDGFFIQEIEIPDTAGPVICGLYGPVMGDEPIDNEDVAMIRRGNRPYKDRTVCRPFRLSNIVQVIGIKATRQYMSNARAVAEVHYNLFTVFGGPLAPKNPNDLSLTNDEIEEARSFWAVHALSRFPADYVEDLWGRDSQHPMFWVPVEEDEFWTKREEPDFDSTTYWNDRWTEHLAGTLQNASSQN
jgi:hypothetical protein